MICNIDEKQGSSCLCIGCQYINGIPVQISNLIKEDAKAQGLIINPEDCKIQEFVQKYHTDLLSSNQCNQGSMTFTSDVLEKPITVTETTQEKIYELLKTYHDHQEKRKALEKEGL